MVSMIGCFNAFQKVSKVKGLSAEVRSLYYTLLGEFNENEFPTELTLGNALLQELAGLSSHQLDTARAVLLNLGVITYQRGKRGLYTLVEPEEFLAQNFGKNAGYVRGVTRKVGGNSGKNPRVIPLNNYTLGETKTYIENKNARAREGTPPQDVDECPVDYSEVPQ